MNKALVLALLAVTLNAHAELTTMPVPNQNWSISFDAPQLTKQKEADKPKQYMYFGSAERFNLSLFVEEPTCNGGASHEDYYKCFWPKAGRNPLIDKDTVKFACSDKYCKIEYDVVAFLEGQRFVQRNINYLFAYRGKWTDLHVSVLLPTDEDQQLLATFENSLAYSETK